MRWKEEKRDAGKGATSKGQGKRQMGSCSPKSLFPNNKTRGTVLKKKKKGKEKGQVRGVWSERLLRVGGYSRFKKHNAGCGGGKKGKPTYKRAGVWGRND